MMAVTMRAHPSLLATDTILKTITAVIVLSVTGLLFTLIVAGPDRYSILAPIESLTALTWRSSTDLIAKAILTRRAKPRCPE